MVRQFNKQYSLSASKSSGGSSGGSSSKKSSGGSGYDNGGYDSSVVKQAQAFVGASADGKWGANSAAAAKKMGYNSLAEVIKAMGGKVNDNGKGGGGYYTLTDLLDSMLSTGTTSTGQKVDVNTRQGQRALSTSMSREIDAAEAGGLITSAEADRLRQIYVSAGGGY